MLALVTVVLVNGTALAASALVGQVPPHGTLEEALASLTGDLTVVLATGLVPAHDTDEIALVLAVLEVGGGVPAVRRLGHVGGGDAGGGRRQHARVVITNP